MVVCSKIFAIIFRYRSPLFSTFRIKIGGTVRISHFRLTTINFQLSPKIIKLIEIHEFSQFFYAFLLEAVWNIPILLIIDCLKFESLLCLHVFQHDGLCLTNLINFFHRRTITHLLPLRFMEKTSVHLSEKTFISNEQKRRTGTVELTLIVETNCYS